MTNVIKFKTLKTVEWTLQLESVSNNADYTRVSNSFMLWNRKCSLEYSSLTYTWNGSCHTSHLYFKINDKLMSPVKITVRAATPSKTLNAETRSISDTSQIIWTESSTNLRGSLLTIEVIIHEEYTDDKSVQTPPYIDTQFSLESSSKDFAKLLDYGPNHDVEFAFGDQIIKAHKSILCCRSVVFTSMLQSDMLEGETGRVNIQDMAANIFQQFLWCLYTGKLPDLTVDIAVQLYTASDKYAVDSLKLQFAHFLIDNLSLENACNILVLADRHNDPEFKKCVMEYIFKEKIPVGEKWPEFCKENQQLAMEVLNSFCQYLCQK